MTLTRVIIVKVSRQNYSYPHSNHPTYIFLCFQLEKERTFTISYTNENLNKRFFFLITSIGGQVQRTLNSVRGEKKKGTVQDVIDLPARSNILGHGIRKDRCIDSFFSGELIAA